MITPKFECRQDHNFVYIHVYVPHVKRTEVELVVDGTEFTFYVKPYFLKLTFSHPCMEQVACHGTTRIIYFACV